MDDLPVHHVVLWRQAMGGLSHYCSTTIFSITSYVAGRDSILSVLGTVID